MRKEAQERFGLLIGLLGLLGLGRLVLQGLLGLLGLLELLGLLGLLGLRRDAVADLQKLRLDSRSSLFLLLLGVCCSTNLRLHREW